MCRLFYYYSLLLSDLRYAQNSGIIASFQYFKLASKRPQFGHVLRSKKDEADSKHHLTGATTGGGTVLQEEKSGIKQNCAKEAEKRGVSREGGREKIEFKTALGYLLMGMVK